MSKTSALAVANFILNKGAAEGIPIKHLKLQKLIYFCYAWYAGNHHEELFSEDVEAWQLGPVVREVYLQFRDCGSAPIHKRATDTNWDTGEESEPRLPPELEAELEAVWNEYKRKSDAWLVEATHAPDEPWTQLVKRFGTSEKRRIPFSLIDQVYGAKVEAIAS